MKILSLFDGMACGMIAMLNAGIEVESYDAYEYDVTSANSSKGRPYGFAAQVASHNFPNIRQHGDVFEADFTQYEGVDYLIGGSPCTYWSIAQKNNRETEASGMGWELFNQYVRALREAQPKYFIYENNKSMANAIRESITETFGFEPICINSALVSAQNRQRLYWVGKRDSDGTYSSVHVDQPEDRGILLRDVLEGVDAIGIGYRGRMEDGAWKKRYEAREDEKANALTTVQTDSMVSEPVRIGCYPSPDGTLKNCQSMRLYGIDGKSTNLTAQGGGLGAKTGIYALPVDLACYELDPESVEKYYETKGNRIGRIIAGDLNKDHDSQQYRVYSTDGKSVTLCSSPGSLGKMTGLYAVPIEFDGDVPVKAVSGADGKTYPVYQVKDGQITIKDKQYPIKLKDGFYIIRKLTVKECMRLQTIPEDYDFSVISETQAYKCLGNGWTCEVIIHLINATQKVARRKWLDELLGDCL